MTFDQCDNMNGLFDGCLFDNLYLGENIQYIVEDGYLTVYGDNAEYMYKENLVYNIQPV